MSERVSPEPAEILREYGPYPGAATVRGVTYDGRCIWFGSNQLHAVVASSGALEHSIDVPCSAGTAFDGRHLYQIAGQLIQKIDPRTGRVVGTIPAPSGACAGLTSAEGSLWVADYHPKKIHKIDPKSGAILRTLESDRFVTGVTWVDGELWHGTLEDDRSELRQVDPNTGVVQRAVLMPEGMVVTGLESDGKDVFFAGGGSSGKVRAVRRPARR